MSDIIQGTPFCDKCCEIMICLDGVEFICNNPECSQSKTKEVSSKKEFESVKEYKRKQEWLKNATREELLNNVKIQAGSR